MQQESVDFTQVAELPTHRATPEQLSMMLTRYHFALPYVQGRRVLELACGAGVGLGYLARTATSVHGLDIDPKNLAFAERHYAGNPKVTTSLGDAHALRYENGSWDAVVFFDSIYFMTDAMRVLAECVRVLPVGGLLLVSTVNREWSGFNPSRQGVRYFNGAELLDTLEGLGCDTQGFGAFPTAEGGTARMLAAVRAAAVKLHLIPEQVRAKEFIKRVFFGELKTFGAEVTDSMGRLEPVVPLARADLARDTHKILYFVARKRA